MKRRSFSRHGTRTVLIVEWVDRFATGRQALDLPVFRTPAFTVGFLAQAVLALAIFKVV